MRIAVLSDTHGLLRPEVKNIIGTCDAVLHAGDINSRKVIDEMEEAAPAGVPFYIVRGNNDKEWARSLPLYQEFSLDGMNFYMVHSKRDIPEDLGDRQIVIFGHSHKYLEEIRDGRLWLNPGSCGKRRFNQDITMAVLTVREDGWHVERIDIPHEAVPDKGSGRRRQEKEHGADVRPDCGADTTIGYYDRHAEEFLSDTAGADLSEIQDTFLSLLPEKALILDFGCGSGRDAKYFLKRGYRVEAVDGSVKMCRATEELAGIPVRQMRFQELREEKKYDGIWACASVLHLSKDELGDVFQRMSRALKDGGILYASFKYGSFEGERRGRHFTDFTEESFQAFSGRLEELSLERMWLTEDVRHGRSGEAWLNVLLRKADVD